MGRGPDLKPRRPRRVVEHECFNCHTRFSKQGSKRCIDGVQRCYKCQLRHNTLMRFYGLSIERYNQILAEQGGVCAICKSPPLSGGDKSFAVDHDHTTKRVRGILCHRCNPAIGMFKDNPGFLHSAVAYLQKWGAE